MDDTNEPLAQRETLIKNDDESWDAFRDRVEMLEPDELAAVADRLGLGEQPDSADFAELFSGETWADFCEAYYHVMREDFSL